MTAGEVTSVLLVDDHPENLLVLEGVLADMDVRLVPARSGDAALKHLLDDEFAVVLLDVQMPDMDGFELAELMRARERSQHTPIIFITGCDDDNQHVFKGYRSGAVDYLCKPIVPEVLRSKVGVFVELFRKTRALRRQLEETNRLNQELSRASEELRGANEALRAQAQALQSQRDALAAANQELERESRERQRMETEQDRFFALSVDMLCIAGFDGYFRQLNPAWERTLGYTTEELKAKPFIEFVHPEDREATIEAARKLQEGLNVVQFENRYLCKDGSYRWLLWNATAEMNERLYLAVARDASEHKRKEAEIRKLNRQLEQQVLELVTQQEELQAQQAQLELKNREVERANELKSQFLANMSHELRTPLNAVIGFSELLLDRVEGPLSDRQARFVEDILASGRHLLSLINDILDLAKIEAGKVSLVLEPLDPEVAITQVATLMRGAAQKKGIAIQPRVQATQQVLADQGKLRQILFNLLSNAVKFSPEGGAVEIGARDAGPWVRFWVKDSGIGMEPRLIEQLFQPFVQGEDPLVKKQQGTGLGLTICKRLVEQHGGAIEVASIPDCGSTLSFTLPAARAAADEAREDQSPAGNGAAAGQPSLPPPAAPGDGERPLVLVIDDEPNVVEILGSVLEPAGYRVAAAQTGHDGLDLARRERPRLAIVDMMLPDITGFELIDALAADERTRDLPVIVLTAADLTAAERQRLQRHAQAVAEKGEFTGDAVLAAVNQAIRGQARPLGNSGVSILVADDQDLNRELVRSLLEARGIRVLEAGDGREAVDVARREHPSLVLMDLAMPNQDGFAALRELQADPATAAIPVVALTALAMRGDEERVREAGFDGYLTKPIERRTFETTIARFLGARDLAAAGQPRRAGHHGGDGAHGG